MWKQTSFTGFNSTPPPPTLAPDGADLNAIGSLVFEPTQGEDKSGVMTFQLPANCAGTRFIRSAVICPNSVPRTLTIGTIGDGTFKHTMKEEDYTFAAGKPTTAKVTRQPFLRDVANNNFKQLNIAPDAIFEVDITNWLTKEELQHMQVEFVVEDANYQGYYNETSVEKMAQAKLQVSSECPGIDGEFRVNRDNRNVLTFRSQGRHTLSYVTKPQLARRKWYIAIWLYQKDDLDKTHLVEKMEPTTKDVKVYVLKRDVSVKAQMMPIMMLVVISVVGGILVLLYFHFLLQERFKLKAFHWVIWFQLMFIYFLRGRKPYAQMTVFFATIFGVGIVQAGIHVFMGSLRDGDRDICQYNERCHSVFFHIHDVSWNSLWSNAIYVIHGLFIILSFSLQEAYCYSRKHYFYYDYCVCYALGWALCFVGLFSAFYHVCPGRTTFQMDTTFMFTMSILILVAVIHGKSTRPEDLLLAAHSIMIEPRMRTSIHAGEIFLFFLAPLVFFNYVGALKDTKPPKQGDYVDKTKTNSLGYGLTLPGTIVYSIAVFIWLIAVLVTGGFKFGLWNDAGKRTKTDDEDENENKGETENEGQNENKEESKKDGIKINNMEEGKAEDNDQRPPNVNRKSQSNQSVSRKWSLTLEKSKFVNVVNDSKEANRSMNRKWRLTVEDSKSVHILASDREEREEREERNFNRDDKDTSEKDKVRFVKQPIVTAKTLGFLRGIYIGVSILIFVYFLYNFITAGDLSNLYLNFCFIIAGTALILGEVFHYREFEQRRKDKTKKSFLVAIIFYYLIIGVTATIALYMFTQKKVYLSGEDVAKSRDLNMDCIFLGYYDSHSMWHIFSSFMLMAAGLRVGQLSEPCRMCSLKLIGEISRTPSIAVDTSLLGINKGYSLERANARKMSQEKRRDEKKPKLDDKRGNEEDEPGSSGVEDEVTKKENEDNCKQS